VGVWGAGPFENDDAIDWVSTLTASDDLADVRATLQVVLDAGCVEAPEGAVAIAAAEVVAGAADVARADLPVEVREWLARTSVAPTVADRDLALRAVLETRSDDSELADLWNESDEPAWLDELDGLVARLASIPSRHLDIQPAQAAPIGEEPASAAAHKAADEVEQPEGDSYFAGHLTLDDVRAEQLLSHPRRDDVRWLVVNDLRTPDLSALAAWKRLLDLETNDAHLQRLDGVEQLPQLRHLHVGVRNRTTLRLDALDALPELVSFGLYPAETVADVSPLGHLTKLRRLWVGHETLESAQRLADVPFHRLTKLEHLSWQGNWQRPVTLTDLSPLAVLTELRHVRLVDLFVDGPLDVLYRLPNLETIEFNHADAVAERERFAAVRPDVRLAITEGDLS
jgi:hypothetical protein